MAGFTCCIVKDHGFVGNLMYMDKVIVEGDLAQWPENTPKGYNDFLRVVLNEDNWPDYHALKNQNLYADIPSSIFI